NAVQVKTVQLDETFHIDLQSMLQAITPDVKIIFCCSPNNPTGNLLRPDDILALSNHIHGIVVVDEAYVEFSEGTPSLVNDVSRVPNLVVLRTLSKAWGLAGIRLGYCIAHPSIVSYLLAIKSPYNVNAVTMQLASEALNNTAFFERARLTVIAERNRVQRELERITCVRKIYPSDTNFLLIEFDDPQKPFEALYRNGIVVRRRNEQRLSHCLRITVGTAEENSMVLKILSEM
ncbi:MAG TPA: aminotransferase class I/II-fold pyridoxal phosphate-dependent enzyme, partial [Bacteroidota bacterium]|nr:aminotransferase class I/II-fold pyridoxal phosphate-dependent enzyme [Bacteroidota bacterium]